MTPSDPAVIAERRFVARLPHPYLRYRYLRWRQKRPEAKTAPPRVAARCDGLLMEVDEADVIDFAVRHFGVWEPALRAVIEAHLRPGDVAVDIGANIGAHTLSMALAVGPTGKVVAVEPGPTTATRLRRNLSLNAMTNVTVVEAAASDVAGHAALYAGPDGTRGRATMDADLSGVGAACEVVTVLARTLCDDRDWAKTRLIKIDVERAEDKVLRGLAAILPLLPPDVLMILESEPRLMAQRGAPLKSLLQPLLQRGARFHTLEQRVDLRSMLRPMTFRIDPVDPDAVNSTSHTDFVIGDPDVVNHLTRQIRP